MKNSSLSEAIKNLIEEQLEELRLIEQCIEDRINLQSIPKEKREFYLMSPFQLGLHLESSSADEMHAYDLGTRENLKENIQKLNNLL